MAPNQLIGPVHAVDGTASSRFIAVLVEHPLHPGLLAWMNIWAADPRGSGNLLGMNFARVLDDEELANFQRRGWFNKYIDRRKVGKSL